MEIIAFTFKASKEDLDLAKRCLNLLEKSYKIYNIPQYKPENFISDNMIIITFGNNTKSIIKEIVTVNLIANSKLIELPSIKNLYNNEKNHNNRQNTFNKINNLKLYIKEREEKLFKKITIREEDLPDLDRYHILILNKIIKNSDKNFCIELSKNGKIIHIGKNNNESIKADIFIDFEELYTLRCVFDILKINELELINHQQDLENKNE